MRFLNTKIFNDNKKKGVKIKLLRILNAWEFLFSSYAIKNHWWFFKKESSGGIVLGRLKGRKTIYSTVHIKNYNSDKSNGK